MRKNKEVFVKDPTTYSLPNNGVSSVSVPTTPEEWSVLRYELESFVCQGEYEHGLLRILTSFLDNLEKARQPAIWVSGFYGSGKSHFVRVLEHLWRDTELRDGVKARSLVHLPQDMRDAFIELSNAGKREGGLWSAAGTLSSGSIKSIRLALLSIILKSAGLPENYALARFVIWMMQNGYDRDVKALVEQKGSTLGRELSNMYMSSKLAESLLEVCPSFASSPLEARNFLKAQYPIREDISEEELLQIMEEVFTLQAKTPGKRPCVLLIFDELQQYLEDDSEKTIQLQLLVQACATRFGNHLLFLATGQADLVADPTLQKLQDRFMLRISLSDTDVEKVVREVVLRKNPASRSEVQQVLDAASGEISRHLVGSSIAPREADKDNLVNDYPLLPARSRFWERFLRSINSMGTGGQLRTQLRIAHEAIRNVANEPLGTVVAGDVIYYQLKSELLQKGVLLRDIETAIQQEDDGTPEGKLRSRLCATIFLLGKLEQSGVLATGLTAKVETMADLLVEDLSDITANTRLRQTLPPILDDLVKKGRIMQVGDMYSLQTREGSEWEREFQSRRSRIFNDTARMNDARATIFKDAVSKALKNIRVVQGESRTPREFELFFTSDQPAATSGKVPVWVRDEWAITARSFREAARAAGAESPIVFLHLQKQNADALKQAIADYEAAIETMNSRPVPATDEGRDAKSAMDSRRQTYLRIRDSYVETIVQNATVYQGGGNEVSQGGLVDSVKRAIEDALVRLFPKFAMVDHKSWDLVVRRCTTGGADPLAAIGHTGDVDKHLASLEMLSYIGGTGKKGSDIRKHFEGAMYGWPRDAVDGVLLSLIGGGFVRGVKNGDAQALKQITQQQMGMIDFFREGISITVQQRIAVRGLLTRLGKQPKNNNEGELIPSMLLTLLDLADHVGGEAPLPPRPDTTLLQQLQAASGNDQFVRVAEAQGELLKQFGAWSATVQKMKQRLPRWSQFQQLLAHAKSLPVSGEVEPQSAAILQNRSILIDPDTITPLLNQVAAALREALLEKHGRLRAAQEQEIKTLEPLADWQKLSESEREQLLLKEGLGPLEPLVFSTNEELLATLNKNPLDHWEDKVAASQARARKVREEAARYHQPQETTFTLPHKPATIHTLAELDEYLADLRATIVGYLETGHTVIL
ncbi:MAG TPA: BREX system P-loop protein BrxC [Ktedonobacteraceae bacterium]|nr:BREX system P-loop protein BrxC [Ktedonobacteraceae bacterium]